MARFFNSLTFALQGLYSVYKTEPNMRIHSMASLLVIILGFVFKLDRWEWCIVLLCILVVFVLEIINTVIEKFLDFYHPSYSQQVKFLKDTSAAAVLLAAIFSVVLGAIIFFPKIASLVAVNIIH